MRPFLYDRARIKLTGVEPIRCLNRLTAEKIGFWSVAWIDDLTLALTVRAADAARVETIATRCLCTAEITTQIGWLRRGRGVMRRPFLAFGLPLAVAAVLFLQNFVWTVTVSGNVDLPAERILRAVRDAGVCFGAWGPAIDSQHMKNQMLNEIPELQWLAVNRSGGCVTVLVSEREPAPKTRDPAYYSNVVASRTGIVTELHVLSGTPVIKIGDPVVEGQLLVSGVLDCDDHYRLIASLAEIYAQTLYQPTLKAPAEDLKKVPTGRICRQVVLIVGKKRIKITGNSSIFPTGCDKMKKRYELTLPGGFSFPVALEVTTLREVGTAPVELSQEAVRLRMQRLVEDLLRRQMVAGTVRDLTLDLSAGPDGYTAVGTVFCEEMIARVVPIQTIGVEPDGENRERGTDRTDH